MDLMGGAVCKREEGKERVPVRYCARWAVTQFDNGPD
jgi:hypothetical protein